MTSTDTPTAASPAATTSPRKRRGRRWIAAGAAILVLAGGYATWTNVRPYTLRASIQIDATPQQVWAVLTDQADYPRWNPFIISSAGRLTVGATLTNVMHDATGNTTFTPTVQIIEPGRELRWLGTVGPGAIFDGQHTFTITVLGPHRVLFTQREDFTGVVIPFYQGRLHASTLPQFRAMNTALAHRIAQLTGAGPAR
jgi:hypothetical protein